jgi:integrase
MRLPARPTVAEAVDAYLRDREGQIKDSSLRSYRSVLDGSTKRGGRDAMGTALAASHLGSRLVSRVTVDELAAWFRQRTPQGMSDHARRRSASTFNGWLGYCHKRGWITRETMENTLRTKLVRGEQNRDWLHPEQVSALTELVESDARFDAYWRFLWEMLQTTGVRTAELCDLRPRDLVARESRLHIRRGKGHGRGKERDIPVADDFIALWRAHVVRHNLEPNHFMFFRRVWRFDGASDRSGHWDKIDRREPAAPRTPRYVCTLVGDRARQAAREGHLDFDLVPDFAITPKVLRKTFAACQLIAHRLGLGGLTLEQLQTALGHVSLETTRIYLPDVEHYIGEIIAPVSTRNAAAEILRLKESA